MEALETEYQQNLHVLEDLTARFREWSMTDNIVPSLKGKLEECIHLLGDSCVQELNAEFKRRKDELEPK